MKPIVPPSADKPLAPYSLGVIADGVVFVSGTLPLDAETALVHAHIGK
jgi:aminoacrylate peracid reductase